MKIVAILLLLSLPAEARGVKKALLKVAEHVALGGGVELGMSQVAGGSSARRVAVGLSSAALVAGWKEGSDAVCGSDTKKQAAWHAATQMLGAGAAAAIKH